MCSILLLFLILTVIFNFLHDFSCPYIVEAEIAPTPCSSEASLVFTPERDCTTKQTSPVTNQAYSVNPSLKRPEIYRQDRQRNGYTFGKLSLALPSVLEVEQEISYEVSELPCPLEFGREAQYRTQSCAGYQLPVGMVWVGRRLGGESEMVFQIPQPTLFRTGWNPISAIPQTTCQREGQERKGGKDQREGACWRNYLTFPNPFCDWFRDLASFGFHGFYARNRKCCKPISGHECGWWTAGNGTSLAKGLPRYYQNPRRCEGFIGESRQGGRPTWPEKPPTGGEAFRQSQEAPQGGQRPEKSASRKVVATRDRRCYNVGAPVRRISTPPSHLDGFGYTNANRNLYHESHNSDSRSGRNRVRIAGDSSARSSGHHRLGRYGSRGRTAQAKLQTILRSCAHSLGISPDAPPHHAEGLPDAAGKGDEKQEEKPPKRQRSLEPLGAQATPSS